MLGQATQPGPRVQTGTKLHYLDSGAPSANGIARLRRYESHVPKKRSFGTTSEVMAGVSNRFARADLSTMIVSMHWVRWKGDKVPVGCTLSLLPSAHSLSRSS